MIPTAKAKLGVSERALAVLDALLSFHPETTLSGDELVVWPSNRQLALKAHGMAPVTPRRHISNWRDFPATATVVRPMLGISPSAWDEARGILGEIQAAVVIAAILQRHAMIASAGGYLRSSTRKAEEGGFSLGPMLMALIGSRKREKARA